MAEENYPKDIFALSVSRYGYPKKLIKELLLVCVEANKKKVEDGLKDDEVIASSEEKILDGQAGLAQQLGDAKKSFRHTGARGNILVRLYADEGISGTSQEISTPYGRRRTRCV